MKNYDILLFTDFEEGHVFPLFKLADNLEQHGFQVCFVGIADTMEIVARNGFDHYVILESVFPKGYVREMRAKGKKTQSIPRKYYLESFIDELDVITTSLNPKLIFLSSFFVVEALLTHYKCEVEQVIFCTFLPELDSDLSLSLGQRSYYSCIKKVLTLEGEIEDIFMEFFKNKNLSFENFEEMALPLQEMNHVLLCPKEFDLEGAPSNEKDVYLGPCINPIKPENHGEFMAELKAKTNKKIIFASMGSQTKEYPDRALKFFNSILKSMSSEALQKYHLVLSLGSAQSNWDLDEIPENVSIFPWVPQLEVLQKSVMAVIHGGLGSVKESIYYGVPTLVIPLGRDQMDNAERIKHHGIGLTMSIDEVTTDTLSENMLNVLNDRNIKRDLLKMKLLFRKAEKSGRAAMMAKALIQPQKQTPFIQ